MTRQEHLDWCKERAMEYCRRGEGANAVASMMSDLRKHPQTQNSAGIGAMLMLSIDLNDSRSIERFIEGFN